MESKKNDAPRMTAKERITTLFAPQKGMKMYAERIREEREQRLREAQDAAAKALASGYFYHGASKTKNALVGWITGGGSAEDDIDLQSTTLRIRSRDLYTGGGLGRAAPATMTTNVVGWGIQPKPKIDAEFLGMSEEAAEEWQKNTLREFTMWAKTPMCDASRQSTFWEMQDLSFLSMLVSGDDFVLIEHKPNNVNPYTLALRLLEADRICTPESDGESEAKNTDTGGRIIDGVEINKDGEVCRYHVVSYHPLAEETQGEKTWTAIDAYGKETGMPNILPIMTVERPEQRRGIPYVAAMIEQIKQLDRYLSSELAASIVHSMLTVFITTEEPDDGEYALPDGVKPGEKVTDEPMKIEMGNGNVYELPPNKDVKSIGNTRAPTAFDSFVSRVVTMIAASVEIPPEVLLHQYNSNYTAARSAILDFWKVVQRFRKRFTERFRQPIYEQWLAEAVALGRVDAPGFFDDPAAREAWCRCQWIGTSRGHVQPVQEANAAKIRIDTGISTGEQEAMEYNGSDFMENVAQIAKERKAMADAMPKEVTQDAQEQ